MARLMRAHAFLTISTIASLARRTGDQESVPLAVFGWTGGAGSHSRSVFTLEIERSILPSTLTHGFIRLLPNLPPSEPRTYRGADVPNGR
ncbi:hypothetical protein DFH09DRAFT_1155488 [Mycena vulgaris]|nr:hypothetical protein DFH09DRAFT_1155488 [Mycena vulgaris]